MSEEKKEILVTQEVYNDLINELNYRKGEKRKEIVEKIAVARDEGDLKENGGYHAAREEQSNNETKIKELEEKLKYTKIVEAQSGKDLNKSPIEPLTLITAELPAGEMKFVLGTREMKEHTKYDVFSVDSPIGKAVIGHKTGETVSYAAPSGKEIKVTIKDVSALDD